MTPYVIRHTPDAFQTLRELPDACVDVTITDPPYSEHCQANMSSGTEMRKVLDGQIKGGGIPRVTMAFEALQSYEFARDLVRVSKRWALSFCTMEDLGRFDLTLGRKEFVRSGVWYKPNSMGQLTGDRPASAYEAVAIMHRTDVKKLWNGRGSYGIWKCSGTRGKEGRHPNEKPLALALMLVAKFSERGETVFDPFCGSGAIGKACMLLGRKYIGMDFAPQWVEAATARVRASCVMFGRMPDAEAIALCSMKGKNNGQPDGSPDDAGDAGEYWVPEA